MWRDPKNAKTQLKYPIPTADVMRNKARAVAAWFGDFANMTYNSFPEYSQFVNGEANIGDLSEFEEVRKRLQCKPLYRQITKMLMNYIDYSPNW